MPPGIIEVAVTIFYVTVLSQVTAGVVWSLFEESISGS
jgi:hypothetical protein